MTIMPSGVTVTNQRQSLSKFILLLRTPIPIDSFLITSTNSFASAGRSKKHEPAMRAMRVRQYFPAEVLAAQQRSERGTDLRQGRQEAEAMHDGVSLRVQGLSYKVQRVSPLRGRSERSESSH